MIIVTKCPREISTDEMMKELAIVFPTLWAARRSSYWFYWIGLPGVWTMFDGVGAMPDGELFLRRPSADSPGGSTEGRVHPAFEAWLANRGWTCVPHDDETFFLMPASEMVDAECAAS